VDFIFQFLVGLRTCLQVLVTSFGELEGNAFLEPRTAQVAIVDHVKQVSTEYRNFLHTISGAVFEF